jgi:hypothetical protein
VPSQYTWPSFFSFVFWMSSLKRCARLFNWSTAIRISRGFYESMVFRFVFSYANRGFSWEYQRFIICVYTEIICVFRSRMSTLDVGNGAVASETMSYCSYYRYCSVSFCGTLGYTPAFHVWCHYVVFLLSAGGDNAVRLWCQQRLLFPWSRRFP